ncbi:histidine phosphatase family protein [Sporolactobacillus sp. THM19-2]|nr:histidine phosphatase family protein [Sporolactobacillus sp. THM19-2]
MKNLYFIRHGQTLFNLLNKVQGASDSLLTSRGEAQADELGARFKEEQIDFDAVFSSDLGRARQTAKRFLHHSMKPDMPIIETENLREVSFGSFEGGSNDTLWETGSQGKHDLTVTEASSDEDKIHILSAIKEKDKLHLAESFEEVRERISRLLDQVSHSNHSDILLFSHGLIIDCVLYLLSDFQMHVTRIPNTSVTKIACHDPSSYHIEYVGRTEHF